MYNMLMWIGMTLIWMTEDSRVFFTLCNEDCDKAYDDYESDLSVQLRNMDGILTSANIPCTTVLSQHILRVNYWKLGEHEKLDMC